MKYNIGLYDIYTGATNQVQLNLGGSALRNPIEETGSFTFFYFDDDIIAVYPTSSITSINKAED